MPSSASEVKGIPSQISDIHLSFFFADIGVIKDTFFDFGKTGVRAQDAEVRKYSERR